MKTLRLWLLVLLAVLLPIRGAVGAAMLCPPMGSAGQMKQMQRLVVEHPAATAAHGAEAGHAKGGQVHDHLQHHPGEPASSGSADKCNLCAAYCSVTPLLSSVPTVAMPAELSSGSFPELALPPPSFVSGGQDRPPRAL